MTVDLTAELAAELEAIPADEKLLNIPCASPHHAGRILLEDGRFYAEKPGSLGTYTREPAPVVKCERCGFYDQESDDADFAAKKAASDAALAKLHAIYKAQGLTDQEIIDSTTELVARGFAQGSK